METPASAETEFENWSGGPGFEPGGLTAQGDGWLAVARAHYAAATLISPAWGAVEYCIGAARSEPAARIRRVPQVRTGVAARPAFPLGRAT